MTTEIRSTTSEDIVYVAEHMRQADVLEVAATAGAGPLQVLSMAVIESERSYTAVMDGVPSCVYGYCRDQYGACVWMLGTDNLIARKNLPDFLTLSKQILDEWAERFGFLYNAVDVNNSKSRRWLRWAGFQEQQVLPEYGEAKLPFILMTRSACVAPLHSWRRPRP